MVYLLQFEDDGEGCEERFLTIEEIKNFLRNFPQYKPYRVSLEDDDLLRELKKVVGK